MKPSASRSPKNEDVGWPRVDGELLSGPHGDGWFRFQVSSRLGVPAVRPVFAVVGSLCDPVTSSKGLTCFICSQAR